MPSIIEVTKFMDDVSKIWTQAGRSFKIIGATIEQPPLPDTVKYTQPIYIALSKFDPRETASKVTGLNQRSDAIDIYFVDKIFQDTARTLDSELNGATFTPAFLFSYGHAGCIIAINSDGYSSVAEYKRLETVRTIAHELGHYLLNQEDEAHLSMSQWNLMKTGESSIKRALTPDQVQRVADQNLTGTGITEH